MAGYSVKSKKYILSKFLKNCKDMLTIFFKWFGRELNNSILTDILALSISLDTFGSLSSTNDQCLFFEKKLFV